MSAIGSGMGPQINPYVGQIGNEPQIQQTGNLGKSNKTAGITGKSPLDVGFERGKGKVASEVAQKAGQVRNPIVEADESFVDFDAGVAKSASKSSLSAALSLEDFDPNEFGGNGINNAATGILESKFSATDADVAKLQNMADSIVPNQRDGAKFAELKNNISAQFGVKLSENAGAGEVSLLAAVAASGGNIKGMVDSEGNISADKLMAGVATVLRDGSKAVNTASDMASGIGMQMNAFRTMINR